LNYVGGWPIASKDFIGLHYDGLTGYLQVHLREEGSGTVAEAYKIMNHAYFHRASKLFNKIKIAITAFL
jgi:hypothetical protein